MKTVIKNSDRIMNVMSQWQDSQTNMISCSYIHHPLQYTSLRVLSKSYQNSILEQSSSMLSESHSVWRWKSMPLTTENTNFFTCYIMVALLTPPPKNAAVTIIKTKTIVEFVECDSTDFQVGINYQTPDIQQICAC